MNTRELYLQQKRGQQVRYNQYDFRKEHPIPVKPFDKLKSSVLGMDLIAHCENNNLPVPNNLQ